MWRLCKISTAPTVLYNEKLKSCLNNLKQLRAGTELDSIVSKILFIKRMDCISYRVVNWSGLRHALASSSGSHAL